MSPYTMRKLLATIIAALPLQFVVNTTQAVEGHAEIGYFISSISGGGDYDIYHYPGAEEGFDNYDHIYGELHNPDGVATKAVSLVEGIELDVDSRPPADPPSGATVNLSIVTANDQPTYIPDGATHEVRVSVSGYEGYKVFVAGQDITGGGTINLGGLLGGWYADGQPTGSVEITFESIGPPPPPPPPEGMVAPTVSTGTVREIGNTSVTLEGILENDGYADGDEPCEYRFSYWKEGDILTKTTDWEGDIYEGETFSASISELTPGTWYYFTADARNSAGTGEGDTESFRTLSAGTLLTITHKEGTSSRTWRLSSKEGALNGLDEHDQLSGQETGPRIISIISGAGQELYELKLDVRENTDDEVLIEARSVSQSGQSKALSPNNKLELNIEDPNTEMTIRRHNPDNLSESLAYDIQTLTDNGKNPAVIELFDPNDPGQTHAFYIIDFNSTAAHYPLNETSGTSAWDKVRNKSGTVHGGQWMPEEGNGGAINLDGIDDYVSIPFTLDPSEGPFSVYARVKGNTPGTVVSQKNGQSWLRTTLEGKLTTDLNSNSRTNLLSPETITDGKWHRVGFVWDGSISHLYVDGREVAQDATDLNPLQESREGLYLGADKGLTRGRFWKGEIDDFIVYDRAVGDKPQAINPESQGLNFEGFETGDFKRFNWDTSAYNSSPDTQWEITSDNPASGNYCARAVNNDKGGNTFLTVALDCKDGEISFDRKLNSSYFRGLVFSIDDRLYGERDYWGGEQNWKRVSYPVSAGTHTFIWFYKQDQTPSDGEAAWIDNITFPLAD